jgi:Zn-dependent protease/predicted transcriptional regulator
MGLTPMTGMIRIGSLFGIPIGLSPTWFLTLALVLLFLGVQVYPSAFPLASWSLHWALAYVSSLIFFASIVAHELAHALVARAHGIAVKEIRLFAFGGVAQIANDPRSPRQELLMAVAGPLTSLGLGGLFLGLAGVTMASSRPVGMLWEFLGYMNILLSVFNLFPAFPMDGGRVVRALLWMVTRNYYRATRWASRGGQFAAYVLIAFGAITLVSRDQLPGVGPGSPLYIGPVGSIWLVFLGLFLNGAARQSWAQVRIVEALRNFRVSDVMSMELPTIDQRTRLRVIDDGLSSRREPFCLFVTGDDEQVIGVLTSREVARVPPQQRATVTAADAMAPVEEVSVTSPDQDAATALQRIEVDDVTHMPVVDDGRLIGVVARDAFMRLLVRPQSQATKTEVS